MGLTRAPVEAGAPEPPYAGDLDRSGLFEPASQQTYSWQEAYSGAAWVQLIQTHSELVTLDGQARAALVNDIRTVLDAHGGTVIASYQTYEAFARVRSS